MDYARYYCHHRVYLVDAGMSEETILDVVFLIALAVMLAALYFKEYLPY